MTSERKMGKFKWGFGWFYEQLKREMEWRQLTACKAWPGFPSLICCLASVRSDWIWIGSPWFYCSFSKMLPDGSSSKREKNAMEKSPSCNTANPPKNVEKRLQNHHKILKNGGKKCYALEKPPSSNTAMHHRKKNLPSPTLETHHKPTTKSKKTMEKNLCNTRATSRSHMEEAHRQNLQ